jgi:protein TonB
MTEVEKLIVCAGASVVLHAVIAIGLDELPPRPPIARPAKVAIRFVDPPREPPKLEPEPPKPEPPKPEPPKPKEVLNAPRPHPVRGAAPATAPKDKPPAELAPTTTDTSDTPVFGVSLESTSTTGHGPALPVGNTARPEAGVGSVAPVKPLPEPVQAFEATKMPLPQGRCYGKYTDDARTAGIEGTVVLDLVVGDDGRVRELHVVQGLGHGLDEAAIAALRACVFSPGEKEGKPVAVKIRGFKIHFVLQEQ